MLNSINLSQKMEEKTKIKLNIKVGFHYRTSNTLSLEVFFAYENQFFFKWILLEHTDFYKTLGLNVAFSCKHIR